MSDLVAAAAGTQPVGILDMLCVAPDRFMRAVALYLRDNSTPEEIAAMQRSFEALGRGEVPNPEDDAISKRLVQQACDVMRRSAPLAFALFGAQRRD